MRQIRLPGWTTAAALFAAALLSFGLLIPRLGLYGDDWIYLWARHLMGAGYFFEFVSADRPFSAWVYLLVTPLFGETVWAYHLYLLILRWLCAVLLWWVLKQVWPAHNQQVAWVALLFVVYPGFRQQPLPLQFILHFSVLGLFLFSLGAMLWAERKPEWKGRLTALALAAAAGMFSVEYFVGLELLRPVLLWLALGRQVSGVWRRLRRVLWVWLPYGGVLAAFLVWRVFIYKFRHYQPTLLNDFLASPVAALIQLGLRILNDMRLLLYGSWRQVFAAPEDRLVLPFFAGLVLGSAVLFTLYLVRISKEDIPAQEDPRPGGEWALGALLLGAFSLLAAGIPIWGVNLPLELSFPWDRSTLPFMLGVSLLTAAVIDLLIQPRFRPILVGGLAALSIGAHYLNGLVYLGEQEKLRSFFWQLTWRAPGLQPGTILFSENIPLNRLNDNSLTPILNWTYAPDHASQQIPYKLFDLTVRLGATLPELVEDYPVEHSYRGLAFNGTTSNGLVVDYNPPGCLRILSPQDRLLPDLPDGLRSALAVSHLSQVRLDADPPARPPVMVGAEPAHEWCYYFQKADLARQKGDWNLVAALGEQGLALEDASQQPSELLPFIEGYARLGRWEEARSLTRQAGNERTLAPALCAVWERVERDGSLDAGGLAALAEVRDELSCPK